MVSLRQAVMRLSCRTWGPTFSPGDVFIHHWAHRAPVNMNKFKDTTNASSQAAREWRHAPIVCPFLSCQKICFYSENFRPKSPNFDTWRLPILEGFIGKTEILSTHNLFCRKIATLWPSYFLTHDGCNKRLEMWSQKFTSHLALVTCSMVVLTIWSALSWLLSFRKLLFCDETNSQCPPICF